MRSTVFTILIAAMSGCSRSPTTSQEAPASEAVQGRQSQPDSRTDGSEILDLKEEGKQKDKWDDIEIIEVAPANEIARKP